MQYRGNPRNSTPPERDLIAYKKIKENPPPSLVGDQAQQVTWQERVLGSEGEIVIEDHIELRGGNPELSTIEDDLCDSYWFYPLLSYHVTPEHNVNPATHAQWYQARLDRSLEPKVPLKQMNKKTYKIITQ